MQNVTQERWDSMSQSAREKLCRENERPYAAANGHKLQAFPKWVGRPIWSSAWTACTDDCPACEAGEPLEDW